MNMQWFPLTNCDNHYHNIEFHVGDNFPQTSIKIREATKYIEIFKSKKHHSPYPRRAPYKIEIQIASYISTPKS